MAWVVDTSPAGSALPPRGWLEAGHEPGRAKAAGAAGEFRLRILKAAAQVAAERGYEGTTIARICERSGLPVSSVYWFYTDKDELLAEVVAHSFNEWIGDQPAWDPAPAGAPVGESLARS